MPGISVRADIKNIDLVAGKNKCGYKIIEKYLRKNHASN